jgi:hypothetical protein
MKNLHHFLLSLAVLCTATAAQAGVIEIVDRDMAVVTGSGQPADLALIQQAIIQGGKSKTWDIFPTADGKGLRGTLSWNKNKHTITIDIDPSPTQITLRYVSSVNMKYRIRDGQPTIHDIYNRQIKELSDAIREELKKL